MLGKRIDAARYSARCIAISSKSASSVVAGNRCVGEPIGRLPQARLRRSDSRRRSRSSDQREILGHARPFLAQQDRGTIKSGHRRGNARRAARDRATRRARPASRPGADRLEIDQRGMRSNGSGGPSRTSRARPEARRAAASRLRMRGEPLEQRHCRRRLPGRRVELDDADVASRNAALDLEQIGDGHGHDGKAAKARAENDPAREAGQDRLAD